jgi:hypothetical protein
MSTTPVTKLNDLRETTTYITGHDADTRKAIVQSTRPASWQVPPGHNLGFNVIYTTSEFPVSLTDDADLTAHDAVLAAGTLGLVRAGGTICRMVDFPPGCPPLMHRTQSLDYGVVLEGVIELELDSGSAVTLRRGDLAVQRATMHAWRNPSTTDWCRMLFILQDCKPLVVGGERLAEDITAAQGSIPPSGNDG